MAPQEGEKQNDSRRRRRRPQVLRTPQTVRHTAINLAGRKEHTHTLTPLARKQNPARPSRSVAGEIVEQPPVAPTMHACTMEIKEYAHPTSNGAYPPLPPSATTATATTTVTTTVTAVHGRQQEINPCSPRGSLPTNTTTVRGQTLEPGSTVTYHQIVVQTYAPNTLGVQYLQYSSTSSPGEMTRGERQRRKTECFAPKQGGVGT